VYILPIRVQRIWLAVDAGLVQQILGQRDWFKVPSAPAQWPGVIAWNGRAVAVLDLPLLLRFPPLQPGIASHRTLVAKARGCLLAIPVEEVREAAVIAEGLVRPIHATRPVYASHELELDDMVMPLLDVGLVVAETLERSNVGSRGIGSSEQRTR
jgi:chemotaxis signal transduction protein